MLPTDIQKIKEETERVEKLIFAPEPTGSTGPTGVAKPKETPPEPTGATGATGQTGDDGKAEHKYSVLKGKYDKEVPKLHKDLKAANERLLAMQSENATLRTSIAEMNDRVSKIEGSGATDSKKLEMLQDLENDPDIRVATENFPDVWKAVNKAIDKKVEAIAKATAGKLEKVESDVKRADETAKNTAEQNFYQYLDTNVQGWRDVNTDDEFKSWLNQPSDKYSGRTKMDLIRDSIGRKDSQTVAAFFIDFAKEKEAAAIPAEVVVETKETEVEKPSVKVSPPKGRAGVPPRKGEADKTFITSESIADFYDKVRRGHYDGRLEERATEEKRIEKAVAEGRIA